jgi:hypothetical protein
VDLGISGEVVWIQGYYMVDTVSKHQGNQTSVMRLSPMNVVSSDEIKPKLGNVGWFWKMAESILKLLNVCCGLGCRQAKSVGSQRPGGNRPIFNQILQTNTEIDLQISFGTSAQ